MRTVHCVSILAALLITACADTNGLGPEPADVTLTGPVEPTASTSDDGRASVSSSLLPAALNGLYRVQRSKQCPDGGDPCPNLNVGSGCDPGDLVTGGTAWSTNTGGNRNPVANGPRNDLAGWVSFHGSLPAGWMITVRAICADID